MATQVQFRRGTTTQNNAFTGSEGELSISTTDYHLRVHDGTTQGGISLALADLSNVSIDTDGVSEGSSNLYYTNARVDAEIDSYLSGGTGVTVASGAISVDFTEFDTDSITEGSSNLYYTDARADARADAKVAAATGSNLDLTNQDTDDLSEGSTNLYYTDARADARVAAATGSNLDVSNQDTDDLSEGTTNLYFTDARAQGALTGGTGISLTGGTIAIDGTVATESYVDTAVANVGDSAPGALDTLNELAAALGDDANFSGSVTNSLALKAPLASPTFTGTVVLPADTSIGTISSDELGYLDGVTSGIQTQLDTLDTDKAPKASPTLTGTVTLPADTSIGSVSSAELGHLDGVTSGIQTQLDALDTGKADKASPTFTGTVALPADTSIGNVSATEIAYVDGVTSAIQTQIDTKAPLASPDLTGVPTAPTAAEGTDTTQLATTAFVQAAIAELEARLFAVDPT